MATELPIELPPDQLAVATGGAGPLTPFEWLERMVVDPGWLARRQQARREVNAMLDAVIAKRAARKP